MINLRSKFTLLSIHLARMGPEPNSPLLHMQTTNPRPINPVHVDALQQSFCTQGLGNKNPTNLITAIAPHSAFDPSTLHDALDPNRLVKAKFVKTEAEMAYPLELLQGQHRIKALQLYLANLVANRDRLQELAKIKPTSADGMINYNKVLQELAKAEEMLEKSGTWVVRVIDAGK